MFLLDLTGAVNTTSDKASAMQNTIEGIALFLLFGFIAFIFIAVIVATKKNRNISNENLEKLSEQNKPANKSELEEFYNFNVIEEQEESFIVLHMNGKTVEKHFTKEQMEMITKMLDAIPEKPKDI